MAEAPIACTVDLRDGDAVQAGLNKYRAALANHVAMTITAFEILTTRKQRARRRDDAREWDAEDVRPIASEQLIERELIASIRALIGEMSELDREALEAMLHGAKPSGETERKRRFRAIERLRAAWRKAHG